MTNAIASLPRNLRGNPTVGGLMSSLSKNRQRIRDLTKLADQAQTPAAQTAATQAGAAAAGVIFSFAPPDKAPLATLGLAAACILGGGVYESPELVSAGNGMLAPFTFLKVQEFLTRKAA